jgi:phage shock protein PspC (stress-responsive transcriptional regulator)
MYCRQCGKEIADHSNFCYFCGASQVYATAPGEARRLRRPVMNRAVGGVCAAFAEYLDIDVTLLRFLWLLVVVFTGIFPGVIAYLVAWMVIPSGGLAAHAPVPAPSDRRLTRSRTDRKLGGVCAGLAEYLGTDPTVIRVIWAVLAIVPGAIVGGIIAYLIAWFIIPEAPAALPAPASVPQTHAS